MGERTIDRALTRAKELGMNQVEFAKAMDVLPQHVTNWKRRGMPPEHNPKTAQVLRCSVDYLLGLTETVQPRAESATAHQTIPENISDEELDRELHVLPRELKISLLSTVRRARQPSYPSTVQPLQTEIPGASERHRRRRKRIARVKRDGW